jgi:hypothetical protein
LRHASTMALKPRLCLIDSHHPKAFHSSALVFRANAKRRSSKV